MAKSESPPKDAQKAASFFRHANEAALKGNFPYAIQMLCDAMKNDPENLLYRQTLRGVERRTFNNEPGKVGLFAAAKTKPIHLRIRGEKSRKHWTRVLECCEDAFRIHPWDVMAAREGAEAAVELDDLALATWLLESVHAQAENSTSYLKQLAQVYELGDQFAKAISCWEQVRRKDPNDEESKRRINALSASATIKRSGYHETLGAKADSGPEIQVEGLDELKAKAESPTQRLVRLIKAEPEEVRHYLDLSEILRGQNRLDDAEKVLSRGRAAVPQDELLRESHADVQMLRLKRKIDELDHRARLNPDDADLAAKLATLRSKLVDFEINELKHRVSLRSSEASLRLELGKALMRAKRVDEAIAELQQVRNDEDHRVEALVAIGAAFEAKSLPKLAQRSYQDALKGVEADDLNTILAIHYSLGKVAEALNDRSAAEEHYGEVAAIDYTYQDVAERLRALNPT